MCAGCFDAYLADNPHDYTDDEREQARAMAAMWVLDMHWGLMHVQIEDDNYDIDVNHHDYHGTPSDLELFAAELWNAAPVHVRALACAIHGKYPQAGV